VKYQPGQSGNPHGRPQGTPNKRTQLAKLLEPHAEALIAKAVELALGGDSNALRMCFDRLLPKAKDDTISFVMPDLDSLPTQSPTALANEIFRLLAGHVITIEQAKALFSLNKSPEMIEREQKAAETESERAEALYNNLLQESKRDY